jgi:hypothetical protein
VSAPAGTPARPLPREPEYGGIEIVRLSPEVRLEDCRAAMVPARRIAK